MIRYLWVGILIVVLVTAYASKDVVWTVVHAPEIEVNPSNHVESPSLGRLSKYSETYLGREITASGTMHMGSKIAYLENEEGSRINVVLPGAYRDDHWEMGERSIYPGTKCTIKGTYNYYDTCTCQTKLKGGEWTDLFTREGKVEDCLSGRLMSYGPNVVYRCTPGTVERVYYLEPIEIS